MKLSNLILPGALLALFLAFRKTADAIDISNQFSVNPSGINFKEIKPGVFSTVIYPEIEILNPTTSSTTIDSISGNLLMNNSIVGNYYLSNINIAPGRNIVKLPVSVSTTGTLSTLIKFFVSGIGSPITLATDGSLNKGAFNLKFKETYNLQIGKGVTGINGLKNNFNKDLLLETTKKMNYALSIGNYQLAYTLLQLGNNLRIEMGEEPLRLKTLEAKFKS